MGMTQAQLLYGTSTSCGVTACNAAVPSVNVKYTGTGAAGDTSIDLSHSGLSTCCRLVSCTNLWVAACRITTTAASGTAPRPPRRQ